MPNGFPDNIVLQLLLQSIASTILQSIRVRSDGIEGLISNNDFVLQKEIRAGNAILFDLINARANQQRADNNTIINKIVNEVRLGKTLIQGDIQTNTAQVIAVDNANTNSAKVFNNRIVNDQTTAIEQITNTALVPIIDTLAVILGQVGGSQSIPDITIDNNIDIINDIINDITFSPINNIDNEIIIAGDLFTGIVSTVGDIFTTQQDENNISIGAIIDAVIATLADFGAAILDSGNELVQPLLDIVQAILFNKDINTDVIEKILVDDETGVGAKLYKGLQVVLQQQLRISADDLRVNAQDVFESSGDTSATLMCDYIEKLAASTDAGKNNASYEWIASAISLLALPMTLSSAKSAACLAVWSEDNPWQIIGPGDVARMRHLGLLTDDRAIQIIQRNGYPSGDAINLLNAAQQLPTVGEMLTFWLRGILNDEGIDFALGQQGINDSYIKALKEIAFFIPPVQDLVTMAVREVFNIEQATAQGQFEEFPQDFADNAKLQGVSEEWAQRYWAAHWVLPSIQMGYEMLHRGVITQPELEDLMKALDVMPVWRDRLVEISFANYTRVDIRRMHSIDVLTESEVLQAYKNIGYNQERAQKLTEFTLELNQDDDIVDLDIASDLTRSNIVGFYVDGIIPRASAFVLLVQAGINIAAAELFLQDADFKIERRERKQHVGIIIDSFKSGGITFLEADDKLRGLSLETEEFAIAQLDLIRVREQLTAIPSRADLDKFIKKEVISEAEYLNSMELLGYSQLWADRYLSLARG